MKDKFSDQLTVGYARAKANFKRLKNPADELSLLREESKKRWEAYMEASADYDAKSASFEKDLEEYYKKLRKVQDKAVSFEDRIDTWSLIKPKDRSWELEHESDPCF
jgi:uncharacterized phage infection (PIP) family protein YhgE